MITSFYFQLGVGNLRKNDSSFQCDFQTVSVSSELLHHNHYIKYGARLSRYDMSLHILAFLYLSGFCSFCNQLLCLVFKLNNCLLKYELISGEQKKRTVRKLEW